MIEFYPIKKAFMYQRLNEIELEVSHELAALKSNF